MTHQDYLKIEKMSKSKLSRFAENPINYDEPFQDTSATDFGSAVDCAFYTPKVFKKIYSVIDWSERPAPKYKEGQINLAWLEDKKSNAKLKGLELITSENVSRVTQIIDNLNSDEYVRNMIDKSIIHKVFEGEINGVEMKCEIDNAYKVGDNHILCDLKTIYDSNKFIARAKYEFKYRMMPYIYSELMRQSDIIIDRVEFLVVDTKTFDSQFFIVSGDYMDMSKELVFKYLDLYKEAGRSGVWSKRIFGEQYI